MSVDASSARNREDVARPVELAPLEVDLDGRLEQLQHHPAGVDLLLREPVAASGASSQRPSM